MKPSIRNTVLVMNDEKKPRDKSLGPTGHNACRDDSPIMKEKLLSYFLHVIPKNTVKQCLIPDLFHAGHFFQVK